MSKSTKAQPKKPPKEKPNKKPPKKKVNPRKIVFTAAQIKTIRDLASCGVNQRTIADYIGISRSVLIKRINENLDGKLAKEYRKGLAIARDKVMKKAFEKATEGKGDTIMLIFLAKCLCGLSDKGDPADEVRDKAEAVRGMLETMDTGLAKFTGPDGKFKKPEGEE